MIDQQQKTALSQKAKTILGDRVLNLSKPQAAILNMGLDRVLLANNGQADQVSPEEIEGAWEMIEEVWGDFFNDEYMKSKHLR